VAGGYKECVKKRTKMGSPQLGKLKSIYYVKFVVGSHYKGMCKESTQSYNFL